MAKRTRLFKTVETATSISWTYADNGATAARIDLGDIPESVRPFLLAYGTRQYIADGSAAEEGTSISVRRAGLQSRIDAILAGTAGMNTIDAAVFVAATRAGLITDSPANRDKWNRLTPAQREAIRADVRVQPFLPVTQSDVSADDILSAF